MKRVFCHMGVVAVLFFGACDSNRKLSQDNAEKAIKGYASTHQTGAPVDYLGANNCFFNVQSIASIERLSQFSDTEATSVVTLKCGGVGTLRFKFVFQKDVDNRWFLMKIQSVEGDSPSGGIANWIARNQNLKVLAQ